MKLLFDFLPIILFFGAFKYAEAQKAWAAEFGTRHLGFMVAGGQIGADEAPVLLATVVVIIATLAQVAWLKVRRQRVDAMLWVSLVLVVVLGGLTIWFHSDTFIKWKPTGLYWAMGAALWIGQTIFRRNLLRLLMGDQLQLPDDVWKTLNWAWIGFFAFMGVLNLWVAFNFETATWVNFKLFGSVGLMLVFTIAQGFYLSKHLPEEAAPAEAPGAAPTAAAASKVHEEVQ